MYTYTKNDARRAAEQLAGIKDKIRDLLDRAERIVAPSPFEDDLACWRASMLIALDEDHGYLAHVDRTMQHTIDDLDGYEEEDDEFEEAA